MIKAVVFDIGNVLLEWNPQRYFTKKFGSDVSRQFFQNVPIMQIHEGIDAGDYYFDVLSDAMRDYPNWAGQIKLWRDDWRGIASRQIDETVDILRRLKSIDITLLTLTNFGAQRCAKPDPAIYEHLERGSGFSGAEIVFADDRADNIHTAQQRGWHAHLFETPSGWEHYLRHLKVL